ncbi:MAG: hypothetical protein E3J72_15110 [Planctomycetota bacterium]|nr:MAG: hypothetical protein E3J72_15110 [Planctomycetota bacterium]
MAALRILIVEEDRKIVEQLRDTFEEEGTDIEIALTLELGLTILHDRRMDLVIINLQTTKEKVRKAAVVLKKMKLGSRILISVPNKHVKDFKKKFPSRSTRIYFYSAETQGIEKLMSEAKKEIRNLRG